MADDRRTRFERECVVHLDAVYRAARRFTRDDDAARDLVQDTLVRAYRAFDTFAAGTNGRAWLLSIVYSVFINGYHRQRRRPATVSMEALEARFADRLLAAPDAGLAEAWTDAEVLAALDELPEEFRATVLLVDVDELTYDEAAAALGCAVGTVRSRLHRARRLLAAALDDYARARRLVAARKEER
ncbi:MAG: sigma-70 family RNA polymerase sigma factor [Vicinamibacterales bacterium]